jgi:hypothetical protein
MSAVIEAKRAMAELGTKAQAVVNDDSLTNAEKKTRLDASTRKTSRASATPSRFTSRPTASSAVAKLLPKRRLLSKARTARSAVRSSSPTTTSRCSMASRRARPLRSRPRRPSMRESSPPTRWCRSRRPAGDAAVPPRHRPAEVPAADHRRPPRAGHHGFVLADLRRLRLRSRISPQRSLEKGTKPQLDLTLGRRQDNVSKIANVAKVTDEMFQDVPAVRVLPHQPHGLRNSACRGSTAAQRQRHRPEHPGHSQPDGPRDDRCHVGNGLTAQKAMEGIFNQITALRATSFVEPDAIVIHPTDWQTIRLGKDSRASTTLAGLSLARTATPAPRTSPTCGVFARSSRPRSLRAPCSSVVSRSPVRCSAVRASRSR